jgi:hypothetical protein
MKFQDLEAGRAVHEICINNLTGKSRGSTAGRQLDASQPRIRSMRLLRPTMSLILPPQLFLGECRAAAVNP